MSQAQQQPEVLDDNDNNWLIAYPDGNTEPVAKSPMNRLMYEHDLWGLLQNGDDVLMLDDGVTVRPNDDSSKFSLSVGNGDDLFIGTHNKSDLIDALLEGAEDDHDGINPRPLRELYHEVRSDQIRNDVMMKLGKKPPFDQMVEVQDDGWLLKETLLLTWENEFYNPITQTRSVSGSSVTTASSEQAYDLSMNSSQRDNRELQIDGMSVMLTDREMEFVAAALWGLTETPTL